MRRLSYGQRVIAENAEENPSYFLCGKKHVQGLIETAEREAGRILDDLKMFVRGDITIEIGTKEYICGYSITATLKVGGVAVRFADPCDLLFLDLNTLISRHMLECGFLSGGVGIGKAEEKSLMDGTHELYTPRPSEDDDDDEDEEIYDGEYGADDFDDDEAVEDAAISAALDGEDSDDEQ